MVKRLIGGLILLNLGNATPSINTGDIDISDEDVLKQLTELRNFIDEKRDFSKNAKDLKPVLVQFSMSDEKIDNIVQCNMGFNTDALHLSIGGTAILSSGDKLTININVEYQHTNYVGYTIKTATINIKNNVENYLFACADDTGEFVFTEENDEIPLSEGMKLKIYGENNDSSIYAFGYIGKIDDANHLINIVTTPFFVDSGSESITQKSCVKIALDMQNHLVYLYDATDTSISENSEVTIDIYTD